MCIYILDRKKGVFDCLLNCEQVKWQRVFNSVDYDYWNIKNIDYV